MKSIRVLQFALVGLLMAFTLQAVGYGIDHAVSRLPLAHQTVYNWLTLLFSPVAFLLRLTNPDGPIFCGWTAFFIALLSNALLYAAFCRACEALFQRLQYKLTHENISLAAQFHPERIIRLASPNWPPRRT